MPLRARPDGEPMEAQTSALDHLPYRGGAVRSRARCSRCRACRPVRRQAREATSVCTPALRRVPMSSGNERLCRTIAGRRCRRRACRSPRAETSNTHSRHRPSTTVPSGRSFLPRDGRKTVALTALQAVVLPRLTGAPGLGVSVPTSYHFARSSPAVRTRAAQPRRASAAAGRSGAGGSREAPLRRPLHARHRLLQPGVLRVREIGDHRGHGNLVAARPEDVSVDFLVLAEPCDILYD